MTKRTRPADAELVTSADDVEYVVRDKRATWRADASKARRRNRRYERRLTEHLEHDSAVERSDCETF